MDWTATIEGGSEEWNGLTVYPVRMRDYPLFLVARESIITHQQSWPLPWSTVPYLEGLIGMGLLPRLCALLKLAFRLEGDNLSIYPIGPHPSQPAAVPPSPEGEGLAALLVVQGERQAEITRKNFGSLRELLALQNGLELPDERANLELVEARHDLSSGGLPLKADLEDLIYSVALKSRTSPGEIMNWTVRRFQRMERAIDRSEGHRMASISLAAGGKFKNGNPCPSWKFDREEGLAGVEPLSALSGRLSGSVEQK